MSEKFNLPTIVLDAKTYKERLKSGEAEPFRDLCVIICSMHFANSKAEEIKKKLDETDKQLLELAITEIRQRFTSNSTEIYVPFKVDLGDDLKMDIRDLISIIRQTICWE